MSYQFQENEFLGKVSLEMSIVKMKSSSSKGTKPSGESLRLSYIIVNQTIKNRWKIGIPLTRGWTFLERRTSGTFPVGIGWGWVDPYLFAGNASDFIYLVKLRCPRWDTSGLPHSLLFVSTGLGIFRFRFLYRVGPFPSWRFKRYKCSIYYYLALTRKQRLDR